MRQYVFEFTDGTQWTCEADSIEKAMHERYLMFGAVEWTFVGSEDVYGS